MTKQLQWAIGGLALLIVGFIVGIVAFQIYLHVDLKNFKEEIAGPDPKTETAPPQTPNVIVSEEKPEDVPGFKWEWDGDHWDLVPIGNPDAPVEHPVVVKPTLPPKTVPKPKKELYTGSLTFHEELLKTNPVKALRLQQEERGHWSAQWIPPFPPDDEEAQEYARAKYLIRYYSQNFGNLLYTSEYEKEKKDFDKAIMISGQMRHSIMSYPYGARKCDLMKISWSAINNDPVVGPGRHPSEYFGDAETRRLAKELGTWKY